MTGIASVFSTLQHVNKRYHCLCHAYYPMNNHDHLPVETPDSNLCLRMRQVNGVSAQLFKRDNKIIDVVIKDLSPT